MELWIIYAIASAVFAALTSILMKYGTRTLDSDIATFYRTIVVVFVSLAFVLYQKKPLSLGGVAGKELWFVALSAICTGLSWLAYFRAIQLGPVSQASLIDKSSVILIVLAGILLFGEALTVRTGLGMGMIIAGMYVLFVK
jgi:bacterial/archaeal transporter family protein